MKKSAIKMIAGVSALAIFSSISATAIPAFAEEYDAIQEQDYVATFADEQTQNVANYLLENGVSMEEAQEMMEHYVNGRAMIEQEENAEDGISLLSENLKRAFYNGVNTTTYKHYGAFIINNPVANVRVTLNAISNEDANGNYLIAGTGDHYIFNGYNNFTTFGLDSDGVSFKTETKTNNAGRPLIMCTFPFDASASLKSEAAVKNAIKMQTTTSLLKNGNQIGSAFTFHTFVLGDFDHDGVVCDKDYTYLMDFILNAFDGYFNYTSVSDKTAFEVNTTAVDINMDGILDIQDAIAWNKLS